jgi:hypothetical protein
MEVGSFLPLGRGCQLVAFGVAFSTRRFGPEPARRTPVTVHEQERFLVDEAALDTDTSARTKIRRLRTPLDDRPSDS